MNTPFALGASVLAVLLWLLSRRRPQFTKAGLRQTAASGPAPALTRVANASGVSQPAAAIPNPALAAAAQLGPCLSPAQLRAQARASLASGLTERLQAMQQLAVSADRTTLPLLLRGLRDPHPQVVLAAAQAMERFRGRTAGLPPAVPLQDKSSAKLPRNARG